MTAEVSDRWRALRLPDKYEIREVLGEGGFGIVYKVYNRDMERLEALKVVRFDHDRLPADKLREDFLREARIMDALAQRSRYIVRVFELGPLESTVPELEAGYFSMEFVPGVTLKQEVLRQGPLPIGRALRLVTQICKALETAHSHTIGDQVGVLHRDLKLENALLVTSDEGEEVRILDFGLSKPAEETGSSRTKLHGAVATLGCAPPEQLSTKGLGPPADIYALGVLTYELVTGHEPWFGRELPRRLSEPEAMDLLLAGSEPEPVPLTEFFDGAEDPRVPKLAELVRKCLRLRPGDRVQSAAGVRKAIREIRVGEGQGGRLGQLYSRAARAMDAESWTEAVRCLEEIVEWDTGYRDATDRLREATRRQELSRLYDEARRKGEAEDWTGVVEVFSRIHAEEPDFPDPEQLLGTARRAKEAAERERRRAELYESALEAMDEGRWSEAAERLQTVVDQDGEYRDAAVKLAEATRRKRLAELYEEARRRSEAEDWESVVELFDRIHGAEPGYPDPEGLLQTAEQAIQAAERERELAALYEKALDAVESRAWPTATRHLQAVVELDPEYRDAAVRLAEATRQKRLAELYEEARRRRDAEDWAGVTEVMDRLRNTEPSYPDPDGLLEAAQEALRRADRERRLAELYDEALEAMDRKAWSEAVERLEAVVELDPEYRDVAVRLAEASRQKRLAELYEAAKRKREAEDWEGVAEVFQRIRATEPNYPDPDGLLGAARRALDRAERRREDLEESYERAVAAAEASDWGEASRLFEAVVDADPAYRDAADRLEEATRQVELADLYSEAKRRREAEDWAGATRVVAELRAKEPEYPDPDGVLAATPPGDAPPVDATRVVDRSEVEEEAPEEAAEAAAAGVRSGDRTVEDEPPGDLAGASTGISWPAWLPAWARAPGRLGLLVLALVAAVSLVGLAVRSLGPSPATEAESSVPSGDLAIEGPTRLAPGESVRLSLVDGTSSELRSVDAVWSSSDDGVVRVGEDGRITAVGEGEATIRATAAGVTLRHSVAVFERVDPVEGVTLVGVPDSLVVGQRLTLSATATTASGGTPPPGEASLAWNSSDPDVLEVDESGTLVAVAPGSSLVTVRVGDASAERRIRVVAPRGGDELQVSITGRRRLRVGEEVPLQAIVSGDRTASGADVAWSVSPEGLVGFGPGGRRGTSVALRGLRQGTGTVTVRIDGEEFSQDVAVQGFLLSSVRPQLPDSLEEGDRVPLRAVPEVPFGTPPEPAALDIQWLTDDGSVADIDRERGELVARSPGSATVTARAAGVSGTATVRVVGATAAEDIERRMEDLEARADSVGGRLTAEEEAAAIRAAVEAYAAAVENGNAEALRTLWPSIPRDWLQSILNLRDPTVTVPPIEGPQLSGRRATVEFRMRIQVRGAPECYEFTTDYRATLERQDPGGWRFQTIEDVNTEQGEC